jgi:hypothetical protein
LGVAVNAYDKRAVQPEVVHVAPALAPIVVFQPVRRLRSVLSKVSKSRDFHRQSLSRGEAALKY